LLDERTRIRRGLRDRQRRRRQHPVCLGCPLISLVPRPRGVLPALHLLGNGSDRADLASNIQTPLPVLMCSIEESQCATTLGVQLPDLPLSSWLLRLAAESLRRAGAR